MRAALRGRPLLLSRWLWSGRWLLPRGTAAAACAARRCCHWSRHATTLPTRSASRHRHYRCCHLAIMFMPPSTSLHHCRPSAMPPLPRAHGRARRCLVIDGTTARGPRRSEHACLSASTWTWVSPVAPTTSSQGAHTSSHRPYPTISLSVAAVKPCHQLAIE